MVKKWLHWLNIALASLVLLALASAGMMLWLRPKVDNPKPPMPTTQQLPPNAFEMPKTTLSPDFFKLKSEIPAVQLPNLRNVLNYYGKNGRPDADAEKPLLHFGLAGGREVTSIIAGTPLYLVYDRNVSPPKYIFSPWNMDTPLWVVPTVSGNQATLEVFLRDPEGNLVRKPQANASFSLVEKDFTRFGGSSTWDIDKLRVDGTLLVRQKARWYGPDQFLTRYGGTEFADVSGKQRIDFGEGDESYSVFVNDTSCLIWKDNRWTVATPGPSTVTYPLMCVRKIDPRLINFELWDPNGRNKITLNLLKTNDVAPPKVQPQNLKFLGARTLSRFLFEVNGERVILTPNEWLIYKENRWHPLRDPKDIQNFVDRKLIAPLFVFDGVVRREDRQVLIGTLYNASRTDSITVELPLLSGANANNPPAKNTKKSDEKKNPLLQQPPTSPNTTQNGENAAQASVNIPSPPEGAANEEDDDDEDSEE